MSTSEDVDEDKEVHEDVIIKYSTDEEGLVAVTAELSPEEEANRRELIPKRQVNPDTGLPDSLEAQPEQ